MDEFTTSIQDEVSWFADYIVLVDETRCIVNLRLEIRRDTLESKSFWLSRN